MQQTARPPELRASVQTARNFYSRCNAMPLYGHCHGVLKTASDFGIVEGRVIRDPRGDPKRQKANSTLAETILYHTVECEGLRTSAVPLPAPLKDEEVLKELDVYCRLTKLERSGAPLSEFIPLLNNGHAPLALLAKIADYAVTHNEAGPLESLVGSWPSGPFRTYSSMDEIRSLLRMDAIAGERIYAPVAELFGYQELAGDILKHSYGVNHPEIYALVMEALASEEVRTRLLATQGIARKLARSIRDSLRSFDYEAEVAIRMQKHEGKLMRKARRRLCAEAQNGSPASTHPALDIETISDWVALRVVIGRHEKKEIDSLPEDRKWRVIEGAVGIIDMCLQTMQLLRGGYSFTHAFKDKENGYRAHHWDMRADRASGTIPLPFEIQLKTSEWHQVAEQGKAAHYYYIGGESEFVDIIAKAYKDILHRHILKAVAAPPGSPAG